MRTDVEIGGPVALLARPVSADVEPDSDADVLSSIAIAVSRTTEQSAVLSEVVRATRTLLDADRASILLLDDAGRLCPAVSVARRDDIAAWQRFQEMPPITLTTHADTVRALEAGHAVAVDRVRASTLIPTDWQQAFDLESLAIAPLIVRGRLCGVLVVDYAQPRRFSPGDLLRLAGIAASGATAVRMARDLAAEQERAEGLDRILSVATALNAAPSLHRVIQTALSAVCTIFDSSSCSLNVRDDEGTLVTTLGSCGDGQPEPGRWSLDEIDPRLLAQLRAAWSSDPNAAVVLPARVSGEARLGPFGGYPDGGVAVVLPFAQERLVRGVALVRCPAGVRVSPDQLRLAASVAGQVWLALERARLAGRLEQRVHQLEALHELADEPAPVPGLQALVERLAPRVRRAVGAELIDAVLCDPQAARVFRAGKPRGDLLRLIRRWQRQDARLPLPVGALVAVPLLLDRTVVGALRVRYSPEAQRAEQDEFLLAVGTGLAETLSRIWLRARVTESERELAVAEERERAAGALHATVGRLLATSEQRLRTTATQAVEPAVRDGMLESAAMIGQAQDCVRDAAQAVAALRVNQRGLGASLRDLGRTLTAAAGIDVVVDVVGTARELAPTQESALLRVAHEAVASVAGPGRPSTIVLRLTYWDDRVELSVRDDGRSLPDRTSHAAGVHSGLRAMQRRLEEAGGALTLTRSRTGGLHLLATAPCGAS